MELKSFKDILLKKASGNKDLELFIESIGNQVLLDNVLEGLEKMAEPASSKGMKANGPVQTYAAHMDNSDVEQLRDALGHHVSHYKGALKSLAAASPEQHKALRSVADQHLNKIVPLMDLAARARPHSNGKLSIDYVKPQAWETNYTTDHRHTPTAACCAGGTCKNPGSGLYKEDQKGLGRRISPGANRERNIRSFPDYHYLEMPPHPTHKHLDSMTHRGGYPFEEIQVGNPSKIDSKKAYLPSEEINGKTAFEPHPFDDHPVGKLTNLTSKYISPEQEAKFADELTQWKSGPNHKQWLDAQREKFKSDPEAYKGRGISKPTHHFEGLPLQDHPVHVGASATMHNAISSGEAPVAAKNANVEQAGETLAVPPKVIKAQSQPSSKMDVNMKLYKESSPEVQKILAKLPDFASIAQVLGHKRG